MDAGLAMGFGCAAGAGALAARALVAGAAAFAVGPFCTLAVSACSWRDRFKASRAFLSSAMAIKALEKKLLTGADSHDHDAAILPTIVASGQSCRLPGTFDAHKKMT